MDPAFDFSDPALAYKLLGMSEAGLNALPFGVVRLSKEDLVTFFSDVERNQSGYRNDPVGQHWLETVAPCMNTSPFKDVFVKSIEAGNLDMSVEVTGDYRDPDRVIQIRLVSTAEKDGAWMLLNRL